MTQYPASLLLSSKLYLPPASELAIERPRLVQKLEDGLHQGHPLTLVSAPAGFGKSTLLSQWLVEEVQRGVLVAWLSLDSGDNDLPRFLNYLFATFNRARPGLGQAARSLLEAGPSIPVEAILTTLINELVELPATLILAFDDYHEINSLPVHHAVRFLLENCPQTLRLVIATRTDPPLPLARLRARGLLTELRLKDLRFTRAEMDEMIRSSTGLSLAGTEIAALEERTEGWGAGLRLATLTLEDLSGCGECAPQRLRDFSGTERHVMDYIIEEVLCCLPDDVNEFLLRTAVLEQFSAPLCEAVLEKDIRQTLEFVDRSNLFLVPLDAQREWFRYHHLFRQALLHQLRKEQPTLLPELHRRAAVWLAENGPVELAIRHALDFGKLSQPGGDYSLAADIFERLGRSRLTFQLTAIQPLLSLMNQLPESVILSRVMLVRWKIQLTYVLARYTESESLLEFLEQALQKGGLPADEEARTHCILGIYRSNFALQRGETQAAFQHIRGVASHLLEDDFNNQRRYYVNLGMVQQALGNLAEAEQAYRQAIDICMRHNLPYSATDSFTNLIDMATAQGQISKALQIGEDYFALLGTANLAETLVVHAELGKALYIANQPEQAIQHLERSLELVTQAGSIDSYAARHILLAMALSAAGRRADAEETLGKAARIYGIFPTSRGTLMSGAARARLWLTWKRLPEAAAWAETYQTFPNKSYPHDMEDNTLAWVRLAQGQAAGALDLLEAALPAAQGRGSLLYEMENLALQALALQRLDRPAEAFQKVRQALRLAETEKLDRIFLDAGPEMEWLLGRLAETLPRSDPLQYTLNRMLPGRAAAPAAPAQPAPYSAGEELVESLSEREVEVLGLIARGLTNAQIAAKMVVSENTVKKHINHIFGKLGVANRTQAILKGRQLGLI